MRLLDTLSGLKRSDALSVSTAGLYPPVRLDEPSAYPVQILGRTGMLLFKAVAARSQS